MTWLRLFIIQLLRVRVKLLDLVRKEKWNNDNEQWYIIRFRWKYFSVKLIIITMKSSSKKYNSCDFVNRVVHSNSQNERKWCRSSTRWSFCLFQWLMMLIPSQYHHRLCSCFSFPFICSQFPLICKWNLLPIIGVEGDAAIVLLPSIVIHRRRIRRWMVLAIQIKMEGEGMWDEMWRAIEKLRVKKSSLTLKVCNEIG